MGNQHPHENGQESEREILIHLFSEDLLSHQVDGIVCFTDQRWSSDNALCRLLDKHGGNRYSSEQQAIKQDNSDCRPSDVFIGDGGMLPCGKVLFCVVGEVEEVGDLEQQDVTMMVNLLEKATREKFGSLAVLLGGGDACPHPSRLIPLIYWKFLTMKSTLQEIHLITLDSSLVGVMKKVLQESHQLSILQGNQPAMPSNQSPSNQPTMPSNQPSNTGNMSSDQPPIQSSPSNTPGDDGLSPGNIPPPHTEELSREATQNNTEHSKPKGLESMRKPNNSEYNSDSDDDASNQDDFVNNMMALTVDDKSHHETKRDDSDLGAVGGAETTRPFTQKFEVSEDDYDDDEFQKESVNKLLNPWGKSVSFSSEVEEMHIGEGNATIRFRRTDSNISVGSVEECLDFDNIPKAGAKSPRKDPIRTSIEPMSPHSPDKVFYCPICMQEKDPLSRQLLDKCEHGFCRPCITKHLEIHGSCPICKCRYSTPLGTQPDGIMSYYTEKEQSLPGYEGLGIIVIEYDIPNGIQSDHHPHPGVPYKGLHRSAFLPDNPDGKRILTLLQKAFDRKLVFTVGQSITTGMENVTTWNDIHHKTNIDGGVQRFGYPDPTYLRRVYDELMAKGIMEDE